MYAGLHLNDVQCFALVCELHSVSRAADSLHTAQSVVSGRIHRLERFTGTRLFSRLPHGIVPNRRGEILYQHAKQLLSHVAELETAVRA